MEEHETGAAVTASNPPTKQTAADQGAFVPYLVVAALGLLAALIVAVQLWAYRDELRAILTQAPV
ncbi:MAG: hypothetical protein M3O34_06100 [Chloroflexota bacterium]|nr:hypothetical protein [Chloroflexota bacterium]